MIDKNDILKKLKVFDSPDFTFDEKEHVYLYKKKEFISVTTFIKKFVRKFDENFWSTKKAIERLKKNCIPVTEETTSLYKAQILEEWQIKKDVGCDVGSITHKSIEEMFNGEDITPIENEESLKRFEKFKILYEEKLKGKIINIAQEIRVFSEELKIAGTIDCLLIRNYEGVWRLEIWDWKTNKKFKTDKDKCFAKMLPPFMDEWENEINTYSIQLNLYKLILASKGIYIDGECALVHLPPGEDKPRVLKCKNYITQLESYFGVNFYSKLKEKHS